MQKDSGNLDGVVSRLLVTGHYAVRLADGSVRVCFIGPDLRQAGTVIHEGDRVVVQGAENGVFRGEIKRVKSESHAEPERPAAHASLISSTPPPGPRPQDQKVDRGARPDWPTGAECAPRVGDVVYCTGGLGTVLRVLGRTGNGSRLLELRLATGNNLSFFAAGANVLMAPREEEPTTGAGGTGPA